MLVVCPKCGGEVRYIALAPSAGTPGQPIAVDTALETLISESGRRLQGYKVHVCPEKETGYERHHDFNPGAGNK